MNTVQRLRENGEEGVSLVSALLILGVLSLVAVASVASSDRILSGNLRSRTRAGAIHAADAGIEYAKYRLRRGLLTSTDPSGPCAYEAGTGTLTCNQSLGNSQSYSVVIGPAQFGADSSVTRVLTSTGSSGPRLKRKVQVTMYKQPDPFRLPLFADASISINGGGQIDWYDSRERPYAGTPSPPHFGDVRSNGNITLSGGSRIYGSATTTATGVISRCNNCQIFGTTSNGGARLSFPPPDVSRVETANDNARICSTAGDCSGSYSWSPVTKVLSVSGGSVRLRSGTYSLCQLAMSGGQSVITLDPSSGPIRIFISGPTTAPCGTLITPQLDPLNITGGTWRYPAAQSAPEFQTYVRGDSVVPTRVTLRSGSNYLGVVYAPLSDVAIQASADLFGSFNGKSLSLGGNGSIHFDKAVAGSGAGGNPWLQTLWIEV
ncbi:MAG TPA: pilus assembly PilX N-terminal domain-containing protein [Actinomycetota bacterium]|nr:pilus assembly PilX N-terminal domain-containing protein [Actinomycetota bacterium]